MQLSFCCTDGEMQLVHLKHSVFAPFAKKRDKIIGTAQLPPLMNILPISFEEREKKRFLIPAPSVHTHAHTIFVPSLVAENL